MWSSEKSAYFKHRTGGRPQPEPGRTGPPHGARARGPSVRRGRCNHIRERPLGEAAIRPRRNARRGATNMQTKNTEKHGKNKGKRGGTVFGRSATRGRRGGTCYAPSESARPICRGNYAQKKAAHTGGKTTQNNWHQKTQGLLHLTVLPQVLLTGGTRGIKQNNQLRLGGWAENIGRGRQTRKDAVSAL